MIWKSDRGSRGYHHGNLSQFLTLCTTPVVYLALDRLRRRRPARELIAEPLLPEEQLEAAE
jgi:hypothetical protein